MSEQRQIAVVRDYYDLVKMIRTRAKELRITRETIDAVSGLQTGYAAKLMSIPPARGLGRVSLGPMLAVLGIKLICVEDADALATYSKQFAEHQNAQLADGKLDVVEIHLSRKKLKELAKRGGEKRAANLHKKRRSSIARRAGKASARKRRKDRLRIRHVAQALRRRHAAKRKTLREQRALLAPATAIAVPATPLLLPASQDAPSRSNTG